MSSFRIPPVSAQTTKRWFCLRGIPRLDKFFDPMGSVRLRDKAVEFDYRRIMVIDAKDREKTVTKAHARSWSLSMPSNYGPVTAAWSNIFS
jgi:hypothetical protein